MGQPSKKSNPAHVRSNDYLVDGMNERLWLTDGVVDNAFFFFFFAY